MSTERFNLAWAEFETFTSGTLTDLYLDTDFVDVTLACEDGHQVKAHKVVLSSCSSFFKTIFLANPHPSPLIYLKGVKIGELRTIIKFIYTGQTEVIEKEVFSFLNTGRELQIKGLEQENIIAIKDNCPDTDVKEGTTQYEFECDTGDKTIDEETNIQEKVVKSEANSTELKRASDGTYECPDCEYRTKHKRHMNTHKMSLHAKVRFECDYCTKAYTDPSSLGRHKRSAHEGFIYPCDQCSKSETSEFNLLQHKSSKHSL